MAGRMIYLLLGLACIVVLATWALLAYFYTQGSSPAPSPDSTTPSTTTPSPSIDPKTQLLQSGQAIQVAEIDTQTGSLLTNPPTGYSGTPSYTMSMDINIAQTASRWRNIFAHEFMDASTDSGSLDARRPCVYVTGTNFAPANRIHVVHQTATTDNTNIVTTFAATPGTYFNLTWVVGNGSLKAYINGQLDQTGTVSGNFTWPVSSGVPWAWMHPNYIPNKNGSINVKNVYFWNRPLTSTEIGTLTGMTTQSTTSHYVPEPYTQY